jgi:hypothetical protein
MLTALCEAGRDVFGNVLFLCRCYCGDYTVAKGRALRFQYAENCGCIHIPEDMAVRFGQVEYTSADEERIRTRGDEEYRRIRAARLARTSAAA